LLALRETSRFEVNLSETNYVLESDDVVSALYRKLNWRLLPFLLIGFMFAYLDRVNVGFAKLQMQSDLGLSDAAYGVGAGIFFVGYVLF
jgi:sugar phosphate permease